ncbi:MAG: hypothetical protein AAF366_16215 [Pseudomonadota bacterium]
MDERIIWFSQRAYDHYGHPNYLPAKDGQTEVEVPELRDAAIERGRRLERGELVPAEEFPDEFCIRRRDASKKLGMPIFGLNEVCVRKDVADVMRGFDLGRTILKPVTMRSERGEINEDYLLLATANNRPTIDDARSEPVFVTAVRRSMLTSRDTLVHPGVMALPSALEGPDLWTDPQVSRTLFLSDPLAQALIEAGFNKGRLGGMALKQVRVDGPAVQSANEETI